MGGRTVIKRSNLRGPVAAGHFFLGAHGHTATLFLDFRGEKKRALSGTIPPPLFVSQAAAANEQRPLVGSTGHGAWITRLQERRGRSIVHGSLSAL
eukprot:1100066-Prymnesium_polylepis.1